jgi:hypothetical protein
MGRTPFLMSFFGRLNDKYRTIIGTVNCLTLKPENKQSEKKVHLNLIKDHAYKKYVQQISIYGTIH